jgi:pyridoxamine 5'-phosphate oxidase
MFFQSEDRNETVILLRQLGPPAKTLPRLGHRGRAHTGRTRSLGSWRRGAQCRTFEMVQMAQDPIERLHEALGRARLGETFDPTAAALATVSSDGTPEVRFVLVKLIDSRGFAFFTHFGSPKAQALRANPRAALAFHWSTIGEQVRVTGTVQRVSDDEADAYFRTRPRSSQLGAWASHQSEPIPDRAALERAYQAQESRFGEGEIPRPPFWGGFRICPDQIEFWYSRQSRLHDRILYTRSDDRWQVRLLQP